MSPMAFTDTWTVSTVKDRGGTPMKKDLSICSRGLFGLVFVFNQLRISKRINRCVGESH